jgi:hypothetical protein
MLITTVTTYRAAVSIVVVTGIAAELLSESLLGTVTPNLQVFSWTRPWRDQGGASRKGIVGARRSRRFRGVLPVGLSRGLHDSFAKET